MPDENTLRRDALVKKISQAMADGKDSGGYDTLLDMYAHIALKTMEEEIREVVVNMKETTIAIQEYINERRKRM